MRIRYFTWYGGKLRVILIINNLIPNGIDEWYEPFMGSAAITLNKHRHKVEVINDLDKELYMLFNLMADSENGKILLNRLLKLKYSEDEFNRAMVAKRSGFNGLDKFEQAEKTYILISQSFNNTRKSFSHKFSQEQYSFSLSKNLPEVYKRLQGVHVENKSALEIIEQAKNKENAMIYLDPPYRKSLRNKGALSVYGYDNMEDPDHIELLEAIKHSKAKIILSGYLDVENDLYDNYLLTTKEWKRYKLKELQKPSNSASSKGCEYIWVNYTLPSKSRWFIDYSTVADYTTI